MKVYFLYYEGDLKNGGKQITQLQILLHGADYNPEQWLDRPDILARDIELMKEAHCNVVSMGMFSWSMLEPEEGNYQFEWLESVINNLIR